MATCNIHDLLSENPCLSALNPFQLEQVKTQMLCSLKNTLESGDPVTCDIQTLIDESACFGALNMESLSVVQAQLLCDILSLV